MALKMLSTVHMDEKTAGKLKLISYRKKFQCKLEIHLLSLKVNNL
jgi:hypothetical protein